MHLSQIISIAIAITLQVNQESHFKHNGQLSKQEEKKQLVIKRLYSNTNLFFHD